LREGSISPCLEHYKKVKERKILVGNLKKPFHTQMHGKFEETPIFEGKVENTPPIIVVYIFNYSLVISFYFSNLRPFFLSYN